MQSTMLRALPACVTKVGMRLGRTPNFPRTIRTAPVVCQEHMRRRNRGQGAGDSSDVPAVTGGGAGDASLWGPRSMMMSPFRSFRDLEQEMEAMMRGFGLSNLESPLTPRGSLSLAVDVQDKEDHYEIQADLPGLSREDIKVEVSPDNVLTISGERKAETKSEEGGVVRMERTYGTFTRSFRLPDHVDAEHIKAQTAHGVLKLTIPKSTEEEAKRTIQVDVAGE